MSSYILLFAGAYLIADGLYSVRHGTTRASKLVGWLGLAGGTIGGFFAVIDIAQTL
jgi:hypothetical protein